MFGVGDYVTRKSYNNDIVFKVIDIRDNIYYKNYEKKYNSLKDNEFNNIVKTIFNNINK